MIEIMDKVMEKLSKKAKYSEVRYMSSESVQASMRNSEFMGEGSSSGEGIAIRALNNSISMGFISSFDMEKLDVIIDRVLKNSMKTGRNKLDTSGGIRDKWEATGKHRVEDLQSSDRIEIMKGADELMKSHELSVRVNYIHHKNIREIFENSSGSLIESAYSRIGYFMVGGYKDANSFEQIYRQFGTTGGMESFDELEVEQKIRDTVGNLKVISSSPAAKPGKYDVVISPEIAGIVAHESCGHPTEWDRITGREGSLAGESFLTGKKYPFKVGSEVVNVIDDPTVKGSYGYYRYDNEGVKARKRYLYKGGMTNEFIHSRESAANLGVEPNGGGRASDWDMEPLARMSTTYIEPGDFSFEELIEDVKNGVYIRTYTEWNIDDIRFNEKYVGSEAYLIENGKITGRLRKPTIETNTINFYSSIDAVSNELEFSAGTCGKGDPEQGVDTWMGGPSVRLRNIYIS
ncbi:MAG: TldD/PmbA family protein [Cuniculiplasma sp.]